MKELLSVCAVAAFIVYGYFIMDKLDAFLANNRRLAEAEIAENSLFIMFDNPMYERVWKHEDRNRVARVFRRR